MRNAAAASWPIFAASMQTGRMQTRLLVDDPSDPDGNGKRMLLRLSDINSLGMESVAEILARPGVREKVGAPGGKFLEPWKRALGLRKLQFIADEYSRALDPTLRDIAGVSLEARRFFKSRQPDQRFKLFAGVNSDASTGSACSRVAQGLERMYASRITWKKEDVMSACEMVAKVDEAMQTLSDAEVDRWFRYYGGTDRIQTKFAKLTGATNHQIAASCVAAAARYEDRNGTFQLDVAPAFRVLQVYLLYLDAVATALKQTRNPARRLILRHFLARYRLR